MTSHKPHVSQIFRLVTCIQQTWQTLLVHAIIHELHGCAGGAATVMMISPTAVLGDPADRDTFTSQELSGRPLGLSLIKSDNVLLYIFPFVLLSQCFRATWRIHRKATRRSACFA